MSSLAVSCRLVLIAVLAVVSAVRAQELAVEDFFRNPEFTRMKLSPNGEWVAALTSINDRRNLAVLNVDDTEAIAVTNGYRTDIADFFWVTDERLVYTIDVDGNEAFGLFAINRDGTGWRRLIEPTDGIRVFPRQVRFLDRLDNDPDHVLVTDNERRKLYPDVFRLDVHTGQSTRIVRNPGYVRSWVADHQGVVRVGIGSTDDPRELVEQIVYRDSSADDWRVLSEHHRFDDHGFIPIAFAADNRTLYVLSNVDRDTLALHTYDPRAGELGELIFGHDEVDVADLALSPLDGRLLEVSYEHERPEIAPIDPGWTGLREAIDAALPNTINEIVSVSDDERRLLILAYSDVDPGSFYLLDQVRDELLYYASSMPWLDPQTLAEMQPVEISARDGVVLRGYLTLPRGARPVDLPLILHPHGGPYGVRDSWGFNRHVQFLASRGYAVLQVNFRGSSGYGKAFMDQALQQWGLAMQDDLTDAVRWAVEREIADPDRVCIYGASYGGYATMLGVTQTPELYQCAVNYAGVVDLPELYSYWSANPVGTGMDAWFERAVGHPRRDRERLEAISPINNLDGLEVPLFIIHGRRDPRVPIDQAERLMRALDRREIDFDVLIKDDEGHGFVKEENNVELYSRLEGFFAEHLEP